MGSWKEEDGGMFVDEKARQNFCPEMNTLVHFAVPRPHSVTPVATDRPRYAVYGWIVTPEVKRLFEDVPSDFELVGRGSGFCPSI